MAIKPEKKIPVIDPATKNEVTANYLRCAYFRGPSWRPCNVGIMPATWKRHREDLERVLLDFPRLFPDYRRRAKDFDRVDNPRYRQGSFVDNWGCRWKNTAEGLAGAPVEAPLADWGDLEDYLVPDPITDGDDPWDAPDWDRLRRNCQRAREDGRIAWGHVRHGFMYMRLYYLRGFQNFMMDIATGEPRLQELIDMVLDYSLRHIAKQIECGVEFMSLADDLGLQRSLPISPSSWRSYILPCYRQIVGLCREHGVEVRLHSDGHILDIIPDLVKTGIRILNPQIRANGLDGLAETARSEVCVHLDLDRQLFPFAGPADLREHVYEAVDRLATPEGGLMLYAEIEPDVPLENVRALCEVLNEVGGPMP